jgi:hypothetical protein
MGSTLKLLWLRVGIGPALLAGALASCAASWPRSVEAPPPEYTQGLHEIDPRHEVPLPFNQLQATCEQALGPLPRNRYWQGCYVPERDLSYYPSDWPSKREVEAVRIHENAHRLGWRHQSRPEDIARAIREAW